MSAHIDIRIPVFQEAKNSNGNKVSVFDVPCGDDIGCFCPICDEPVGAKNKDKSRGAKLRANQKVAHFYHQPKSNCNYKGESLLHKLAKEVFMNNPELLIYTYDMHHEGILGKTQLVKFDDAFVEEIIYEKGKYFRIDIIAIKNGKSVLLEFVNTHYMEESKINTIRAKKLNCIEIDLNLILNIENLTEITQIKNELHKFFSEGSRFSRDWIYNNKYESNKIQLRELERREKASVLEEERERKKKEVDDDL